MSRTSWMVGLGAVILWILVQANLMRLESPTFDEPVHVKAGWEYWRGNWDFDPIEPPLLRIISVLPTYGGWVEKDDLSFANYRVVMVLIGSVLVGWVVVLAEKIWGTKTAILLALMVLLEPSFLAHGHYVTTDFVSSLLVLLSVVYWIHFPDSKWGWVLPGLAAASKVSMLVYLAIAWILVHRKRFWVLLAVGGLIVWSTYGFRYQPILSDTRSHNSIGLYPKFIQQVGRWNLPLGGYLEAIKENYLFSRTGLPIYFAGKVREVAPWWKQFGVLMFKVPWSVWLLAGGLWILGEVGVEDKKWFRLFAGWTGLNMVGRVHLGIRHELVLVWILLLWAARMSKYWWSWLCLLPMVLAVVQVWPMTITYSNSGRATWWHSDSDFDWGGGLIELKKELAKIDMERAQVVYFGSVDPAGYGLNGVAVEQVDWNKPVAISVTCWQTCGGVEKIKNGRKNIEIITKNFVWVK